MYRDIIDGKDLAKLLPDLPEELAQGTLEIFIRAKENGDKIVEAFLQRIKRQIQRGKYLGKDHEVFFFESEEIVPEWRRPLLGKLKEMGYDAEFKEGARGTIILSVSWTNA